MEDANLGGSMLWRRLDCPGHDACRLEHLAAGDWRIDGAAVFFENEVPVRLGYRVDCDPAWRTRSGEVAGSLGTRTVQFSVERTARGVWTLNGNAVPNLEGCLDLDLGFTPATNLLQLRRVALREGQATDVPVAWLDVWAGALERLAQRYERRSGTTYWYEAERFGYRALLEVDSLGFATRYPDLWVAEPTA
jgi:hypothetical protein